MKVLKILTHLLWVFLLTLVTQVGGLVWGASLMVCEKFKLRKRIVFPVIYLLSLVLFVPLIAKPLGRVPLPAFDHQLKPRNWFYVLGFRNYVAPELKSTLQKSAEELSKNHIVLTYLDANFPFCDGFPLLPHLSHNDGSKVDLSFLYLDKNGQPTEQKPSVSGYGVFAESHKNNTVSICKQKGYWQYHAAKYLTFGTIHNLDLDRKKTKILIQEMARQTHVQKLFLEPHLKESLGLASSKIRFHGCHAVRHDDHVHVQIK